MFRSFLRTADHYSQQLAYKQSQPICRRSNFSASKPATSAQQPDFSGPRTPSDTMDASEEKTSVTLAIRPSELLQWLSEGRKPGKDFVLIDLRREDHQGGSIRGSINLPAQSLPLTIFPLYDLISSAKVDTAIFFCGSSRHRGTAAAKLLQELITANQDTVLKSYILEGGINGWAKSGQNYIDHMDGYKKECWLEEG